MRQAGPGSGLGFPHRAFLGPARSPARGLARYTQGTQPTPVVQCTHALYPLLADADEGCRATGRSTSSEEEAEVGLEQMSSPGSRPWFGGRPAADGGSLVLGDLSNAGVALEIERMYMYPAMNLGETGALGGGVAWVSGLGVTWEILCGGGRR